MFVLGGCFPGQSRENLGMDGLRAVRATRRPQSRKPSRLLASCVGQKAACSVLGLAGGAHSPCRGSFPDGLESLELMVAQASTR